MEVWLTTMNSLGAHEVLELHEVLSDAIHGLNTLKLYRPHARDQRLQAMVDRHMQNLTMEYNHLVQMAHRQGASQAVPSRLSNQNAGMLNPNAGMASVMHSSMTPGTGAGVNAGMNLGMTPDLSFHPIYGLRDPQTQTPAGSVEDIDDLDVTICLVNCHKQTAVLKMKAALEMADPTLRHALQTAANTSANLAYEAFQYANQQGYYQVPALKETTMNTFMDVYGMAPAAQAQAHMQMQQMHSPQGMQM